VNERVTFVEMAKQIPVRIAELFVKLISVKGVVLGLSTWLALSTDVFDGWMLLGVYVFVILGREAFKYLEVIRGR